MVTKSSLFAAYNKARVAPKLNRARVNRALGIVQKQQWQELGDPVHTYAITSSDGQDVYHVNGTCECKDYQYRTIWCKHRIARALIIRASGNPMN